MILIPRQAHKRTGRGEGAMGEGGGRGVQGEGGSLEGGLVCGTFFREWYCRRNSFEVCFELASALYLQVKKKKKNYIYRLKKTAVY